MYTGTVLCIAFLIEFRCEYSLFLDTMNINASLKAPATLTTTKVVHRAVNALRGRFIWWLSPGMTPQTCAALSTGTLVDPTNRGRNFYSFDWWYVCLFEWFYCSDDCNDRFMKRIGQFDLDFFIKLWFLCLVEVKSWAIIITESLLT